ncbi:MAG: DUF441 domain-containing protein [Limnochordia bacterium]|jgi:uncharacterized membrane protein (DUF441 family)|nr:DUF441 domain-containing protein [Bacillota bacterium]NLL08074.1 DUF441 domain-containing protein [Bacillota bacterium]HBG08804.1 DUF441 domain-containing protein [Bacillota bacterium]
MEMVSALPLLIIFVVAILSKNNLLGAAAAIVFFLDLMRLNRFFPLIQARGLEAGLLFLTIALMIPFATGQVTLKSLASSLLSPVGILSIVGGLLGAYLNSQGLEFVAAEPSIIPGILIGVMLSVSLFGGVSVGPIMAAGITALLIRLLIR